MEDCSLAYKKVTGDESTCHFDRLIHRRSADDGTMMGQPECWHAKSLPGGIAPEYTLMVVRETSGI